MCLTLAFPIEPRVYTKEPFSLILILSLILSHCYVICWNLVLQGNNPKAKYNDLLELTEGLKTGQHKWFGNCLIPNFTSQVAPT